MEAAHLIALQILSCQYIGNGDGPVLGPLITEIMIISTYCVLRRVHKFLTNRTDRFSTSLVDQAGLRSNDLPFALSSAERESEMRNDLSWTARVFTSRVSSCDTMRLPAPQS